MPGNVSNSCNEAVLTLTGCDGPVFLGVAEFPELLPVAVRGVKDFPVEALPVSVEGVVVSSVEATADFSLWVFLVEAVVGPKVIWFFNPLIFVSVNPLTFLRSSA